MGNHFSANPAAPAPQPIVVEGIMGSESRFVLRPLNNERAIHQLEDKEHGTIGLSKEDDSDRFQKVLIKKNGSYANIRWDKHPQHFWTVEPNEQQKNKLVTRFNHHDGSDWKIITLGKREQGKKDWLRPTGDIDWNHMKNHELKMTLFNVRHRSVLAFDGNELVIVPIPSTGDEVDELLLKQLPKFFFVAKCVTHEMTSGEVGFFAGGVAGFFLLSTGLIYGAAFIAEFLAAPVAVAASNGSAYLAAGARAVLLQLGTAAVTAIISATKAKNPDIIESDMTDLYFMLQTLVQP